MKFDYSNEALRRMAEYEDKLGPIGGGESVIGGFAQANRKHNEATAALHALSGAFGMIADHAVFAALHNVCSWAMVRLGDHLDNREAVLVRIENGTARDYELWMPGGRIAHVNAIDARPVALRALRAAVDARLAGADWPAVVAAAQRAANGGE